VESEEQLDFLKDVGCDAIQGYLFYKPMPVEELPDGKDMR
jgi:EAL domain-containing protein (putative c-di-GMP-specific phosphodiesterase class I)